MNIILKFGEHYYEAGENSIWIQLLLVIVGGFISFGTALLIYSKSIRRDEKEKQKTLHLDTIQKKKTLEEENNRKLKYQKLLIDNLLKSLETQVQAIKDYLVNQTKDLVNTIPVKQIMTNDFKRLIFLNSDIFETTNKVSHDTDEWIEDFKELHTKIDFTEGMLLEIKRINSNHLKTCYDNALNVKKIIETIPDKMATYAIHLADSLGDERWNNELYVFVDSSLKIYSKLVNEKADFNKYDKEYLAPLIEIIVAKYATNPYLDEISIIAKQARVKMGDIKSDTENIFPEYESAILELEKSITRINELNEEINNVL